MWPALLLLPLAGALPSPGPVPGPPPVSLPLHPLSAPALLKRGIPHQRLGDLNQFYAADVHIGTPPQPVTLLVDTGSWLVWTNPTCARAADRPLCEQAAAYRAAASSSPARLPALDTSVAYGGGWGAILQGYADVFTWGGRDGTQVRAQQFAVANFSVGVSTGVLGLGPDGEVGFEAGASVRGVLGTMLAQGVIASRVFGLAMGVSTVPKEQSGTLIFGGVDRNRFVGKMFSTPILPPKEGLDGAWRYWVNLTQVKHNRPDNKEGVKKAVSGWGSKVFVDSGTTGTYLAQEYLTPLLADMGLEKDRANPDGFPLIHCDRKADNGSLEFSFGANSIKVPYSALIIQRTSRAGDCVMAIGSSGNSTDDGDTYSILGLSFMKAAFAVFDWDNRALHLAQGANCGEPDLVALPTGATPVSAVSGNCK